MCEAWQRSSFWIGIIENDVGESLSFLNNNKKKKYKSSLNILIIRNPYWS
jgi:hypothetical protein